MYHSQPTARYSRWRAAHNSRAELVKRMGLMEAKRLEQTSRLSDVGTE
jgi:hypothetical protein